MSKPCKKGWAGGPYKTDWVPGNPVLETDRALAMDRALLMSQLFRAEYFEQIVNIINGSKDVNQFNKVCASAGITDPAQQKWLWNYLKNYDVNINWSGTGW